MIGEGLKVEPIIIPFNNNIRNARRLLLTYRRVAIEGFTEAVWNRMPIDLKLCEERWADEHMVAEGWNNHDSQFKEVYGQLQIEEEAVATGAAARISSTVTAIQTEMQEASLQIIQEKVARYIYTFHFYCT